MFSICGFLLIWAINKKKTKWWWGVGMGIGLALVIVELASPSSPHLLQQNHVIEISSSELYAEYQANAVTADQKYKNQTLKVSGVVSTIGYDITGTPYVVLPGGGEFGVMGVQCTHGNKDKPALALLTKGQTVTIQGDCDGYMINVLIKYCVLIP